MSSVINAADVRKAEKVNMINVAVMMMWREMYTSRKWTNFMSMLAWFQWVQMLLLIMIVIIIIMMLILLCYSC